MTEKIQTTTLTELNRSFRDVDGLLNTVGYIPIISTASGLLRATYGSMQIGLAVLLAAKLFAQSKLLSSSARQYRAESEAQLWYAAHGFANISRGSVEAVVLIGNIVAYIYDRSGWRFGYEKGEKIEIGGLGNNFSLDSLQDFFTQIESLFNDLGHIPIVSWGSGSIRMSYGLFQIGMSLLLSAMQVVTTVYTREFSLQRANHELDYLLHGLANIARGWAEQWMLYGNIAGIIYDESGMRLKYPQERKREEGWQERLVSLALRNVKLVR